MDHLHQYLNDDPVFMKVSAAYQMVASPRSYVRPVTLLAAMTAGWMNPVNEQDPRYSRSLLLSYLATFPEHAQGGRPGQPVSRVLLEAELLSMAAIERHGDPVEVALRLLDLGADPFLQDREGRDALDQAFSLQWLPVLDRVLADPRASVEALAARTQHVRRREPSVGQHPGTTGTAAGQELPWLHAAAAKGRTAMIDRLLDHGLDVNQRDAFGRTALFYAPFDATVQQLLDRGADPTVRDRFQELPNAAWTRFGLATEESGRMATRFLSALRRSDGVDPEALKNEQRPALFHQAISATLASFTSAVRDHGFSPDETMVIDGRRVSLLAHASLNGLNGGGPFKASPSIASMLASRVKAPMHETVKGVPDVVLAWLFAHTVWQNNGGKAKETTGKVMGRCLGWDQPGGFERSLDTVLLPIFERLLQPGPRDHGPDVGTTDPDLAWFQTHTRLDQVRCGVAEALKSALATPPFVLPKRPTANPPVFNERGEDVTHQPAIAWEQARDARGVSLVWRWAALATHHHGVVTGLNPAHNLIQDLVGGPQQLALRLPAEPEMVHALLDILGHTSGSVIVGAPVCDWGRGTLVCALHQALVELRIPLDTQRPGLAQTMAQLGEHHPLVFQAVERMVLEGTLQDDRVLDGPLPEAWTARARPRL